MAAVLAAGDGAALSHLSAAVLWQIWRRRPPPLIDVVTLWRRDDRAGVRFHRCRRLDPRDTTVYRGIPVSTVPRILVDLTDVLTVHQLASVIHEAAFRKRFNERATKATMERANGRRNLHVLEAALAEHMVGSAGTRSDLEDEFLALVARAGLPSPLVNVQVQAAERTIEVDFHWPDHRLCVEVDGPGHRRPRTRRDDRARDRWLREAGHEVIRLSDDEVQRHPARTIATLDAAVRPR
jgi:very-short-patch-repair endonuclease